jgi:hypothetical protein
MNAENRKEAGCSLAAEVLHSRGTLQLRATGISMLPTLWPGDLLTIQSRKFEQVEAGEIVLYSREGRFFVHRVLGKSSPGGEPVLITRGDCMSDYDPPIGPAELLGTLTEIYRDGSLLAPTRKPGLFRRMFARLLCHWSLFRRTVLRLKVLRTGGGRRLEFRIRKALS